MLYAVLVAALVLTDQLTKHLVRANIPPGGSVPLLPGVAELTYVENTGAAFSILRDHTWLLTILSAAVVLLVCWMILRGQIAGRLGLLSASLVLAGGVGNLIDRVALGCVTDMIRPLFIDFPVFNIADCCVTVGVPLLFLYLALAWRREEKEGGKDDGSGELPSDGR